jgi:hypothetical protein
MVFNLFHMLFIFVLVIEDKWLVKLDIWDVKIFVAIWEKEKGECSYRHAFVDVIWDNVQACHFTS